MNFMKKQKEILLFILLCVTPLNGMFSSRIIPKIEALKHYFQNEQQYGSQVPEPSFYQKFMSSISNYFSKKEPEVKTSPIRIPLALESKMRVRYEPEEGFELPLYREVQGKDGKIRISKNVLRLSSIANTMIEDLGDSNEPVTLEEYSIQTIDKALKNVYAAQTGKIASIEKNIKGRPLVALIDEANLIEQYDFPKKALETYKKVFEESIGAETVVNSSIMQKVNSDLLKQWWDVSIKEFFRELRFSLIKKNISQTEKYVHWQGKGEKIKDLAFNKDATQLAAGRHTLRSGDSDKWAVFDAATSEILLSGGRTAVKRIAFDPRDENKMVIKSFDEEPQIYDVNTKKSIVLPLPDNIEFRNINTIAFSPDGKYRAFGLELARPDTVCLVDRETGKHEFLKNDYQKAIDKIVFSKDSKRCVALSPNYFSVWDIEKKSKIYEHQKSLIYSIDINYAANKILIGYRVTGKISSGFLGITIDSLENSIKYFDITDPNKVIIKDVIERKKINDQCAALWLPYENEALIWDNFGGIELIAFDRQAEIIKKQVVRNQESLIAYTPFVIDNNAYKLAAGGISKIKNNYIYLWDLLKKNEQELFIMNKYTFEELCLLYCIVLQSKKGKISTIVENSPEKGIFDSLNDTVKKFLLEKFLAH